MKIILTLTGEISAGKGTSAAHIKEDHGGSAHSYSGLLRDIMRKLYLEENRENLQKLSTILRENFDDNILSEVIYGDVKKDRHRMVTIDGARRLVDVEYLKKLKGFKLVYIETDIKKRYERLIERRQNADDRKKTFEEFRKDHKREAETQIRELKSKADFVVDNNGNFGDLYRQLDKIVRKTQE